MRSPAGLIGFGFGNNGSRRCEWRGDRCGVGESGGLRQPRNNLADCLTAQMLTPLTWRHLVGSMPGVETAILSGADRGEHGMLA